MKKMTKNKKNSCVANLEFKKNHNLIEFIVMCLFCPRCALSHDLASSSNFFSIFFLFISLKTNAKTKIYKKTLLLANRFRIPKHTKKHKHKIQTKTKTKTVCLTHKTHIERTFV